MKEFKADKPRLNLGSRFTERAESVVYIDTEFSEGDFNVIVGHSKKKLTKH